MADRRLTKRHAHTLVAELIRWELSAHGDHYLGLCDAFGHEYVDAALHELETYHNSLGVYEEDDVVEW